MSIDENEKKIYSKVQKQWFSVSEKFFRDYVKSNDSFRKKAQRHGCCKCPKDKWWLCDTDCANCEYQTAGDCLSLDFVYPNEIGEEITMLDMLDNPSECLEEIVTDKIILNQLFNHLAELMPEAKTIGELRSKGMTDSQIANTIGVKRTTFLSRLKKAREVLKQEYDDLL